MSRKNPGKNPDTMSNHSTSKKIVLYRVIISFLLALFIFGLGLGAGYGLTTYFRLNIPATADNAAAPQNFGLFWEAWRIVERDFYSGIPGDSQPTYGAIKGALAALNDPYTLFVEPRPRALEKAQLDGRFGGIGAFVSRNEAGSVLLEPMVDSPAEQAGLLKGDVLIQVDDTLLDPAMTTDEVVLLIRGEVGAPVTLVVRRAGESAPLTIEVIRQVVETPSVVWRITPEDPAVGYVQLRIFSNRTTKELERALSELQTAGATRYLLDLRGNGGGLLDAAVGVAGAFLEEGAVLIEDRRDQDPKIYSVRKGGFKVTAAPLVILVDGGTASASEIVAGALQDYGRATLVGERTYGKGSVQLVYDLSDQSSVHVTIAKWFTPNQHNIDGEGLTPDVEVLFSEDDHAAGTDPQYLRALELLQTMP